MHLCIMGVWPAWASAAVVCVAEFMPVIVSGRGGVRERTPEAFTMTAGGSAWRGERQGRKGSRTMPWTKMKMPKTLMGDRRA